MYYREQFQAETSLSPCFISVFSNLVLPQLGCLFNPSPPLMILAFFSASTSIVRARVCRESGWPHSMLGNDVKKGALPAHLSQP